MLLNFLDECVENTKQAVTYRLETEDFRSSPTTFHVLRTILENRYVTEQFSLFSSPITHPCPIEGCGTLNDLSSINPYQIEDATITLAFECNTHGRRLVTLDNKGSPCSVQLSKPLRRLVRTIALAQDTVYSRYEGSPTADGPSTRVHMQIQGWENAGTLQEQMLWRPLILLDDAAVRAAPPVIVYTPLICDWAGAKLSSLMYVEGKYEYLKENGMEYLLSLEALRREGRSLDPLFRLVETGWKIPRNSSGHTLLLTFTVSTNQTQEESISRPVSQRSQKTRTLRTTRTTNRVGVRKIHHWFILTLYWSDYFRRVKLWPGFWFNLLGFR
ncbi:hypothetical protein QCA50_000552 [Cerrena zonata]|uniref:Uncharacterized protein n=1 Tax=Cerrena zonata TaxID=2478898 RepID=A0AAW0GY49_9APHY